MIKRIINLFKITKKIKKLITCPQYKIIYFIIFIKLNIAFWQKINQKIIKARNVMKDNSKLGGWIDPDSASIIYACLRCLKPQIIVETGIGPGMSSLIILKAIKDNRIGKLFSIDLPGEDKKYYPTIGKNYNVHVPSDYVVGWLVDKVYFPYWEKLIGDSKDILPDLIIKLGSVDVFMHDSLHTDEQIDFEFSLIKRYANAATLYICDDVNKYWSEEFIKFTNNNNIDNLVYRNRLGIGKQNLRL